MMGLVFRGRRRVRTSRPGRPAAIIFADKPAGRPVRLGPARTWHAGLAVWPFGSKAGGGGANKSPGHVKKLTSSTRGPANGRWAAATAAQPAACCTRRARVIQISPLAGRRLGRPAACCAPRQIGHRRDGGQLHRQRRPTAAARKTWGRSRVRLVLRAKSKQNVPNSAGAWRHSRSPHLMIAAAAAVTATVRCRERFVVAATPAAAHLSRRRIICKADHLARSALRPVRLLVNPSPGAQSLAPRAGVVFLLAAEAEAAARLCDKGAQIACGESICSRFAVPLGGSRARSPNLISA